MAKKILVIDEEFEKDLEFNFDRKIATNISDFLDNYALPDVIEVEGTVGEVFIGKRYVTVNFDKNDHVTAYIVKKKEE